MHSSSLGHTTTTNTKEKEEEEDGNEEEEADSDGDFKRERMTSFVERMLAANPEVTQKTEDHDNNTNEDNIIRLHT